MGRTPRIWFPGACYHIVVRGNRRQEVFREHSDRHLFLGKVRRVRVKTGFKLHAYVLMTNHIHLLLETGNVSGAWHSLNSTSDYKNKWVLFLR